MCNVTPNLNITWKISLTITPASAYFIILCLLVSSHALAHTELETLVISGDWLGNASAEEVKVYPGAREVVREDELQARGALNLEDVLSAVPGMQVLDETSTGILPNIGVRGLNSLCSERAQFLVDGYPIAIGSYTNVGVSLLLVTLSSIEQADIVRGVAVHYGPNNVGGLVNLITRPISKETTQTFREKLTIAEETGNVFTDTYYRISGHVNDDLALQFQGRMPKRAGFVLN